ncbi:hypothetical protein M5K25_014229 [Dendrobium thyrsiflorum]|uniref:Uncharacterized protein n=1 Tax=Dendrobium thyrsiflorum TaxID=117978 RepID=A0ABD0UW89_DENTH
MDDLLAMEVSETGEDLVGDLGKEAFRRYLFAIEGSAIHKLEEDLDLTGVVVHAVASDHEGVVGRSKDLDLAADLAAYCLFMVSVDDFECEDSTSGAVADHINRAAAAAADAADAFEVGEAWGGEGLTDRGRRSRNGV